MNPNQNYTETKFNQDAIDSVYKGVNEVAEAVATTLGPMGRNVLIDKGYETSIIHDGVNVSLIVNPEEPFARNGANVMKEATKRQRDLVGDGTTCVAILTQAILNEALKIVSAGNNPMMLRRGLESGANKVCEYIKKNLTTPVKTLAQKRQIATISAEDEELGKLVSDTIEKVGSEGIITVEESKGGDTYVEIQEGMQIDKGYAHELLITDPERLTCVVEDVQVLVTDLNMNNLAECAKFINDVVAPNTKKICIIAPEIGGDFLQAMIGTKLQGKLLPLLVRAPGIGSNQRDSLLDIAALTGAKFITKESGVTLDEVTFNDLGRATRIISSRVSTIITGGKGKKTDVLDRILLIKTQMKDDDISEYDREQLNARLGRLTNGVAVIKVSGQTEVEMKERKERVIDSVASTKSACKHGMVAGGEVTYLNALHVLDTSIMGEKILKNALTAPFKRLVENAGFDGGEQLNQRTLYAKKPNFGFDVTDGTFKDMIDNGIIDSAAIPTTAIQTAVSVAVQLSSLGSAIVIKNKPSDK